MSAYPKTKLDSDDPLAPPQELMSPYRVDLRYNKPKPAQFETGEYYAVISENSQAGKPESYDEAKEVEKYRSEQLAQWKK